MKGASKPKPALPKRGRVTLTTKTYEHNIITSSETARIPARRSVPGVRSSSVPGDRTVRTGTPREPARVTAVTRLVPRGGLPTTEPRRTDNTRVGGAETADGSLVKRIRGVRVLVSAERDHE